MIKNPRKETARHEYFFPLSMWETALGSRKAAAHGGLFSLPKYYYKTGELILWMAI